MPSRWHLHLAAHPTSIHMHHLHAVISGCIGHSSTGTSDFALCPPEMAAENTTRVEIRLLRDDRELVDRFVDGVVRLDRSGGVRLGSEGSQRTVPILSPTTGLNTDSLSLIQAMSWAELRDLGRPTSEFTMHFLSPYFSRQGGVQLPVPMPGSVLRSLSDRWHALAPEFAPRVRFDSLGLAITDLRGETLSVALDRVRYTGFVGEVTYVAARANATGRLSLGQLLTAAPFTGVGSSTAYGFGVIEIG